MLLKTLHGYIFRELLRNFLLTAAALTTLLAFGGMFQPLTKFGVEGAQLIKLLVNLMPAMLAYSIPMAALFAAVVVYWRMSTDNELTACRASGVSFTALVVPAFALGLLVASMDLIFVNYVVPKFLQNAERAVRRDLGALLVNTLGRQEPFRYDRLIIYADRSESVEGEQEGQRIVYLQGLAVTRLNNDGKPDRLVVARQARISIFNDPNEDGTRISIDEISDAVAFEPKDFNRVAFSLSEFMPDGRPLAVPSAFRDRPKFMNIRQLNTLYNQPYQFAPVGESVRRISDLIKSQGAAETLVKLHKPNQPITFDIPTRSDEPRESIRITAASARNTTARQVNFETPGGVVRVEQLRGGEPANTYIAKSAELQFTFTNVANTSDLTGTLTISGDVKQTNHIAQFAQASVGTLTLGGLVVPSSWVPAVKDDEPLELVRAAQQLAQTDTVAAPPLRGYVAETAGRVDRLLRTIKSERHSRGSFAVSCLTLVLLGAALGILLRGKNPLAVFVTGFVPAIVLVLLITAGRQVTESAGGNEAVGLTLIWAGNFILLAIVAIVYSVLLRK